MLGIRGGWPSWGYGTGRGMGFGRGMGRGAGVGLGMGRGAGFGRGMGTGRGGGNPYPFCRFNPRLPRRWWAYGHSNYPAAQPSGYDWDPYYSIQAPYPQW